LETFYQPKDIHCNSECSSNYIILKFLPAEESRFYILFFRFISKWLFKYRFCAAWLKQDYHPSGTDRTVYYLNHHSWWDGLIPLLLNEYLFHQQARALMEDKQIRKYRFFRKIGAFSIDREHSRQTISSLRYAVQSMDRPRASLFIYPEGKLTPPGTPMEFEGGLSWLYDHLPGVDFVPVALFLHCMHTNKPELLIHVGSPVQPNRGLAKVQHTAVFQEALQSMLDELRRIAGTEEASFKRFL